MEVGSRRGDLALLFIRTVDRPISHADICLSKITFLLMAVNVPCLCRVIEGTSGREGGSGEVCDKDVKKSGVENNERYVRMEKWNGKLWDGDGGGIKVGQNDISYLRRVVGHFFFFTPNGHPLRQITSRFAPNGTGSLVKD